MTDEPRVRAKYTPIQSPSYGCEHAARGITAAVSPQGFSLEDKNPFMSCRQEGLLYFSGTVSYFREGSLCFVVGFERKSSQSSRNWEGERPSSDPCGRTVLYSSSH